MCAVCAIIRVRVCRYRMYVEVCASMCWHPISISVIVLFVCFAFLLLPPYHVAFYHTVPQALKLPTLWQPRYSSSRTASFVWTTSMRVLTLHTRVYHLCATIRKHVSCATTTAAVMFQVNNNSNSTQQEFLRTTWDYFFL